MFENEHNFRKLVHHLKIDAEPNPAHRQRLRRQMLQTFEAGPVAGLKSEVSSDTPVLQTSHFKLPTSYLALAAAIVIMAGLAAWHFVPRGPATLRQVRLATQKAPWLHAFVSRYRGGEVRTERQEQHWCNFAAQKAYARLDDNSVVGWEYGAEQKKLMYTPRLNILTISDLPAPGMGGELTENLPCVFALFAGKDDVTGSIVPWDGKTVLSFAVEKTEAARSSESRTPGRIKAVLRADRQTRHLVAASIEYQAGTTSAPTREEWVVSYPSSGPASVYDLGVPAATPRVDSRQQRIGTPGAEPTPLAAPTPMSGFRLVPVEIQLPKPLFDQQTRTRPPFLAPAGTTNVALGKPVSSSDPEPVLGSLSAITDGNKEATEDSFVELSPGPQHITIDLQERCEIDAVLVWHYHRWPRTYRDVVVQVSNDPAFRTGVQTIFNNDAHNTLGCGTGLDLPYPETYEGKLLEGKGARGRYVRLHSNGNTHDDLNHYIEVEVYGRPVRSRGSR